MRVGFVGLGNIGGAIAANLVADGHDVTVLDLDPAKVAPLVGAGATAATTRPRSGRAARSRSSRCRRRRRWSR